MANKRANGEGSIFKRTRKRADGTEYIQWTAEYTLPTGKTKTIYGKKQQEVKDKLAEALSDLNNKTFVKSSEYTMEEYITNWQLSKRDLSSSTKSIYKQYIDSYITPYIGNIKLQKLELTDVEKMFSKLMINGSVKTTTEDGVKINKGLKPSVLRKVKFILSAVMEKAIEEDFIRKNFIKSIKLPKMNEVNIKPLSKDEIKKLLDAAKSTPMYIPLLLDIATGLRRGELLGLQWGDIDLDSGTATISRQLILVDGKTEFKDSLKTKNANRQIGIPDKVLVELRALQAVHNAKIEDKTSGFVNEGLVICQENGKHYHPRNFAKQVDKIFALGKIDKRRIHDIRHSYATQLLSNGAYINEVQMALGHADAKTTLGTYGHILPGRQKELANRMNDIIE